MVINKHYSHIDLLDGGILTGILVDKAASPDQSLDSHNEITDIESCIDDPSLAPLGTHVKIRQRKSRMNDDTGEVHIQRKQKNADLYSHKSGSLLLRRRTMGTDQLAAELDNLLSPPLTPFLLYNSENQYNNLTELDISRNRLTHLPHQISQLTHLRILNATANLLDHIPNELYSLKELHTLILSQNSIRTISENMPIGLPNLITFRISGNLIESLPNKVHLWTQMRHLQLGSVYGGNRLEHLPENIALMPVLEDLDVSSNLLKSLPCNMEIKSLQLLNVSSNHLDFIPKSIARCINLRNLNISKNHLTSLPTDLIHLKKLELFDISENLLCILPAEILESMQSTTLLLRGNPLTRPGHCDLPSDQDAYSKIIRQMTQRGVPRSSPGLSHKLRTESHSQHYLTYNQCGPTGMGCLNSSSPIDPITTMSPIISTVSSRQSISLNVSDDVDESIDYELSFHAQQLNVDGSRPCEPDKLFAYDDLIGTAHSKVVNDNISNSQYIMMDSPQKKPLPNCTLLLHSLREIASRTVLSHPSIQFPLEILPPHLMEDLSDVTNYKACSYCRGPFINEWVTSVQVKGFGGHPAVVRRVRFCSTKCWYACIPKDNEQSKSVICVHRP